MKAFAGLLIIAVVYYISYWSMVKGWGIEPVDFAFVIWSYIALFVVNIISTVMFMD